jgi:penicillin-insensitive murein endopeptidase
MITMKNLFYIFASFASPFSYSQTDYKSVLDSLQATDTIVNSIEIETYYQENKGNDLPSKSFGTYSKGSLQNGKLIPFKGKNFTYFDAQSYLNGRAFLNGKVLNSLLKAYKQFETLLPERMFYVMECSNADGGKLFPHRTHQNGLSIDFMMPLIKDGKAFYGLDTLGADHYFLEFDNSGKYKEDPSISIDFNLVAHHILILNKVAKVLGVKLTKIIINTDLKDELFATKYGQSLKASGIYVVQKLSPLINSLHDDHYHIDFEIK